MISLLDNSNYKQFTHTGQRSNQSVNTSYLTKKKGVAGFPTTPPMMIRLSALESHTAGEVNDALAATLTIDQPKTGRVKGLGAENKTRMIQRINKGCFQFQADAFRYRNSLHDAHVHVKEIWTIETVQREVAKGAGCRGTKQAGPQS